MKVIQLKKLPDFPYTSPLYVMTEAMALMWAEGRGAEELYWCIPSKMWIIRRDDVTEDN